MKFIGVDDTEGRRLLLSLGVAFHEIGHEGSDLETEIVAALLPEGERHVRGTFDATPPEPGSENAAHCAWHINAVDEAHTITSGLGIFEFWTGDGAVTVLAEAGDLMVNRGAEQRFRPLTDQQLRLRHSGSIDGDFGAVDTGRAPDAWPEAPSPS